MSKREGELKAAFTEVMSRLLPRYYVLRYTTAGAPDREIIGAGYSTRWEFKHGTPQFESIGLQELTCTRLAGVGHCRYVIWQENAKGTGQRTLIVHPKYILNRDGWDFQAEASTNGFDHHWLCEQIRKVHQP